MRLLLGILPIVIGVVANQGAYLFNSAGSDELELMGACSATADEIRCWDTAGKPSEKWTRHVNSLFETYPADLRLRLKKKNRMVLIRSIRKMDSTAFFNSEVEDSKGVRLNQAISLAGTAGTEVVVPYWYYAAPDEKSADITITLRADLGSQSVVALKEGAETKLGPYKVKIGSIGEPSPHERYVQSGGPIPQKMWKVGYTIEGPDKAEMPQLIVSALDSAGQPFLGIDKDGNPTTEKPDPRTLSPRAMVVDRRPYGDQKETYLLCSIRPEKVTSLKFAGIVAKKVVFKNVVLDPSK